MTQKKALHSVHSSTEARGTKIAEKGARHPVHNSTETGSTELTCKAHDQASTQYGDSIKARYKSGMRKIGHRVQS